MRRHRLINGNGQEFNLTDEFLIFHSTSGYGFEREDQVRRIGNRFVRVTKEVRQSSIVGTISFYGENQYEQYSEFAAFIETEPLVLCYTPDKTEFKKDVFITRCSKPEINKAGILEIAIDFTSLSPWYREVNVVTGEANIRANGFIFPVTFPVKWRSTDAMSVVINSDTVLESPVKITIDGPIRAPKWRHYVNGEYAGRGDIEYDVLEGNRLVIDTTCDPYRIYIEDFSGKFVSDVYQFADFATERFIFLKKGKNVLTFSSTTGGEKVPVKVEAKLYYDTV